MQNPDFWSKKSYRGQDKSADHVNLNKNSGSFGTRVVNPEQLYIENKSSSYTSYYLNPGNGVDNQAYDEYFSYSKSQEQGKVEEINQTVKPVVSRDPRLQKRSAELSKGTVVETLNQVSNSPSTDSSSQSSPSKLECAKRYKSGSSSVFSQKGSSASRNSSYSSRFSLSRDRGLKRSPLKNRFTHFPLSKVPRFDPNWKNASVADRKNSKQETFKSATFDRSSPIKSQHNLEVSFKKDELSENELINPGQLSKETSICPKFKPAPSTDKSVENLINKLFTDEQQKQFLSSKQKDLPVKTKKLHNKKLNSPHKILKKKLSSSAFINSKWKKESSLQKDCKVSEAEKVSVSSLNEHIESREESLPMTLLADSLSDVAANFLDVLATSDSHECSVDNNSNECAVKPETDCPVIPTEDIIVSIQSSLPESTMSNDNCLLDLECKSKSTSNDRLEEITLIQDSNVAENAQADEIHTNNEVCYHEELVVTDMNEVVFCNEVNEDPVSISINEVEINNSDGESQNNSDVITESIILETDSALPASVAERIIINENSELCIIEGELNEQDLLNAEFIFITDENDITQLHRISVPENEAEGSNLRHAIHISENDLVVENVTENKIFFNDLSEHATVQEHFVLENNSVSEMVNLPSSELPCSSEVIETVQIEQQCTNLTNNSTESLLPSNFTNDDACSNSQVEQQCTDTANNSKDLILPENFSNNGINTNVQIEESCTNSTLNSKESLLPDNLTNEDICESLNKIFSENISMDKNSNIPNSKNDVCEELCFNLGSNKVLSSPTSENVDVKSSTVQASQKILHLDSDLSVENESILITDDLEKTDDICFQGPSGTDIETIDQVQSNKSVEYSNYCDIAADQNVKDLNSNNCNETMGKINNENNCDLLNKIETKISLLRKEDENKISPSKAKKTIQSSSKMSTVNDSILRYQNVNEIEDDSKAISTAENSSCLTITESETADVAQNKSKLNFGNELLIRKTGEFLKVTYNKPFGVSKKTFISGKVNEISETNILSPLNSIAKTLTGSTSDICNVVTSSSDSEKNSSKSSSLNNRFTKKDERDQNHKRKAEDSPMFSGKVAKKSIPRSNANQNIPLSGGISSSSSCTVALKTFKKPFTAAKKSVVEPREQFAKKVALKTVVKRSSFPKPSCKSLIKNHQAKKSAGSNALNPDEVGVSLNQQIASIMQQGYTLVSSTGQKIFVLPSDFQFKVVPNEFLGAAEEVSEEESRTLWSDACSPVKEIMKFKSSCSCVAEEIPCLCNDEKLQETCEAEDTIDDKVVVCTNNVSKQYLLTPSSEIRHRAYCDIHFCRLRQHHCCPKCGIFCTQGKFIACTSEQPKLYHLFHPDCFLVPGPGLPPGCPHCCEFSNFNMVHLFMKSHAESNTDAENNMKAMKSITEDLENCKILMKINNESQAAYEAIGFVPSKQELQSVVKTLVHDKALRLRPTGKCLYNPIRTGDVKKVVQIIANGGSPNHRFKAHKNNTPLHTAATCGFVGIIHVLLQAGALIDACNDDLETPLLLAVEGNHLAAVKYLMYAGAQMNVKDENGLTAFHRATKNGFKDVAQFLYDTGGFDINLQDNGGWTPLVWTCEYKHAPVVRWLLDLGADPNIRDKEENTALHWTAYSGESKIAEELLDYGCNISFVNQRGDSALHIAARENNFDCIKLFLIRGAALDTRNKENMTAIMCCQERSASWNILNQALGFAKLGKLPAEQNVVFKDISRGTEFFPIQAVNEVDDEEFVMEFQYVLNYCDTSGVEIVRTVNSMRFCYCKDDCLSGVCMCAMSSKSWYDENGCLLCDFDNEENTPIFECNKTCHCPKSCSNRVVQKGIRCPLQLFRTRCNGWGVRSLKDLPKGAFVCEYVGEIISEKEAEERGNDTYFFDLESQDSEYFVDGRYYGNVSRFFNHSCEPNLVAKKVYVDHQDLNLPRIAFFTKRATLAYEELCFDYGIDFWIVKSRSILCTCSSALCKYSKDSIDNTIQLYQEERLVLEATMSHDDA